MRPRMSARAFGSTRAPSITNVRLIGRFDARGERCPREAKITGEVQLTTEPRRVDDVIEVWADDYEQSLCDRVRRGWARGA